MLWLVLALVPREGDFQFPSGMELHLGTAGQLALRPHLLEAGQGVPGSAALHPLDDQQAVTEGLGRNRGVRVVFDAQGRLHLSGLVLEPAPAPRQSRPAPKIRRGAPRGTNGVPWH